MGSVEVFETAREVVDRVVGDDTLSRDLVRTQTFTDAVIAATEAPTTARADG